MAHQGVGINIEGHGAVADADSLTAVSMAILSVFQVGFETHMAQDTIQAALGIIGAHAAQAVPGVTNVELRDMTMTLSDIGNGPKPRGPKLAAE